MRNLTLLLAFCFALLLPAFGQMPSLDSKINNDAISNEKIDNGKINEKVDSGKTRHEKIDDEFVQKEFGNQFTVLPGVEPTFGDLDGDGVEDIAIAARCKNPMLDQAEHDYTVVDPYDDYFGYGDPKLTTRFSEGDPAQRGLVVLIIYGAVKEGWRAATPKSKYVVVNLPYRNISVRKMKMRKRSIEALYVEESGETGDSSAVFFDGKKFHYVPMGGNMQ
jgi:hypothetical protein